MAETQQAQTFEIVAQYTKDFSFENITPVSNLTETSEQPDIKVQLQTSVENGNQPNLYVVDLIIEITAKVKETTMFLIQLDYRGEFSISGFANELMEPLLHIECPRMLFPFARSIIASATTEGGLPPLFLNTVDFGSIYAQHLESNNQTKQ